MKTTYRYELLHVDVLVVVRLHTQDNVIPLLSFLWQEGAPPRPCRDCARILRRNLRRKFWRGLTFKLSLSFIPQEKILTPLQNHNLAFELQKKRKRHVRHQQNTMSKSFKEEHPLGKPNWKEECMKGHSFRTQRRSCDCLSRFLWCSFRISFMRCAMELDITEVNAQLWSSYRTLTLPLQTLH